MIKLKSLINEILSESEDYKGEHAAPDKESGAPLYNVVGIYPEDFYGPNGAREYGRDDTESYHIVASSKDRPNRSIKVYRAVPYLPNKQQKIIDILRKKAAFQRRGRLPHDVPSNLNKSNYYDSLNRELEKLQAEPDVPTERIKINPGDWVTLSRNYAVQHGQDTLLGKYKILTKTVLAKHLFTDGASISEWGYDPS